MIRMILAAVMAVFLCAASAACDAYDDIYAAFQNSGTVVLSVRPEAIENFSEEVAEYTGDTYEDVTRAFIVMLENRILVGLEVDACLLPPIVLDGGKTSPGLPTSGRAPDGRIGA